MSRTGIPSRLLSTAAGIVVVLSVLMALVQWAGMAGHMSGAVRSSPWWALAAHALLSWVPWIALSPLVAFAVLRFRIGMSRSGSSLLVHAALGVTAALTATLMVRGATPHVVAGVGPVYAIFEVRGSDEHMRQGLKAPPWSRAESDPAREGPPPKPLRRASSSMIFEALPHLVTYAVLVVILSGFLAYRDARSHEAELAHAKLRLLRGQLEPHFLFNTLNSINTLIASDADEARRMVIRLADLLRSSFSDGRAPEKPLARELAFIKSYLGIERTRLGPDLVMSFDIEPGVEAIPVPTLCLQPLVENAIKHGVGQRASLGEIRVSARRDANSLILEVSDDGPGISADGECPTLGVGLGNIRDRVAYLYGVQGTVSFGSPPGGGFLVRLCIPVSGLCSQQQRSESS